MKKILATLLFFVICGDSFASQVDVSIRPVVDKPAVYKDANAKIEDRVADLMSRMSIEEKVFQLASHYPNGNIRLQIPHIQEGECLHGIAEEYATSFPQASGLGCTWNPELIEECASVIAKESRALGIHHCYTPMLGVVRDPRWGRTEEAYGEDPYLVSRIGVGFIRGLQGMGGERFGPDRIIATAKHYVGDGEPYAGSNGSPLEISERKLYEIHLPPFRAAIEDAQVGSVMPAHHSVNGEPCHMSKWLLDDVLRKEMGFDGFIVSDNGDIRGLTNTMKVAKDKPEAAFQALQAGVDTELSWMTPFGKGRMYGVNLLDSIANGRIPVELVDKSCARVLRAKFALGLFESDVPVAEERDVTTSTSEQTFQEGEVFSYNAVENATKRSYGTKRANYKEVLFDKSSDELALKAANQVLVLLKNANQTLPLDTAKVKTIAVIGPNAAKARLGGYSTRTPRHLISPLDGIKKMAGEKGIKVLFEEGCSMVDAKDINAKAAIETAKKADVVLLCLGGSEETCRENQDRDSLNMTGAQEELMRAVVSVGKPVVLVLIHGRPLDISWADKNVDAILDCWYPGQEGGTAIAQTLFGENNPGGKLSYTYPRSIGQIPIYYNRMPWGRRVNYFQAEESPLYEFGFGLSYTSFDISRPTLAKSSIAMGEATTVSVTVTNTGKVKGDEVVQLYIRDDYSQITRPLKELKGFKRITLEPGQSKVVTLPLGMKQLEYWCRGEWIVDPGTFTIMVGSSSDIYQKTTLTVTE